ncbi:cobalt-precorrin-6A reductase [Baaleninema simplex]|uniref:cobalt-precorrin-6A reductase n=1 Tax=Baaleninema simplex TaxID=2862350 RepID=UPI00034B039D|nr:cobalt-precorrin-6A reductase [Baaleninema simplex]
MIWLIGGTSESRSIAQRLSQQGCSWVATVVTPSAVRLYQGLPGQVQVGALDAESVRGAIAKYGIRAIVDASHPFATEISHLAMSTGLPYLRFEREDYPLEPPAESLPDLEALFQPQYLENRRVLLTLGVKALPRFRPWQQRSRLWARILPTAEAQALQAGFSKEQLICDRPGTDIAAERALWQRLQVDTVVTKASGAPGGVPVKLAVARTLGVRLLVVDRPSLAYLQQTQDLDEVVAFCLQQ